MLTDERKADLDALYGTIPHGGIFHLQSGEEAEYLNQLGEKSDITGPIQALHCRDGRTVWVLNGDGTIESQKVIQEAYALGFQDGIDSVLQPDARHACSAARQLDEVAKLFNEGSNPVR